MPEYDDAFVIQKAVRMSIERTVGRLPAETGGLLGMQSGVICAYYFDETACSTHNEYRPDIETCERIINDIWLPEDVHFCGFVHSHTLDSVPSRSDEQYTRALYDAVRLADPAVECGFYSVIAIPAYQKTAFSLHPYRGVYSPDGEFVLMPIQLREVD